MTKPIKSEQREAATEHAHTNALIHETSPYLLQHAHNPVQWYPWGEEALVRARTEDKPILLSIGYSACHWCHVMEHESFENEEIARLMNDNFVNIKVDREERPDLDQIYMNAVQMMTGHGGWPMTMFLTPAGVPFYGGTYFPPQDRYNMPGFPRVLMSVAEAYRSQPDQVANTSTAMLGELRRFGLVTASKDLLSADLLDESYRRIISKYDEKHGGFGTAPKFPPAMTLEFLLHMHYRSGAAEALDIVQHTCRKMAEGGLYDQLGGGFHRYSTDANWLVPHFEKMLYDNALLSRLYLHLYQQTKDGFARRIAEETLDYVVREMTDASGGFYSTQDADSEGEEGKFFVWSKQQILEALGNEDGKLFCDYFDVTDGGNFEGHNILNIKASLADVAKRNGIAPETLGEVVERGRKKLFEIREKRIKPGRDEKILTAWNGLMLTSFAEASAILQRDDYGKVAEANAEFILANLERDGLLLRTHKDGESKLNAYLEDYACLIEGLISLYEATGKLQWLESAIRLSETMIDQFWDEEEGGFFFTGKSHEQLIVRSKDFMDNATPSGNSVAAFALQKLGLLTGNENYTRLAVTIFRSLADQIRRYPSAFSWALCGLDFYLSKPKEIAIVALGVSPDLLELFHAAWQEYLPNRVIALSHVDLEAAAQVVPLLAGKQPTEGHPTAFVCETYTCQAPVNTTSELRKQLTSTRSENPA
ncbi:MAG TPA: thioredoxin domain-containing protein [Pyrinomonadaceae bacterium]|nr:thioredoxin domain-containing protein [Pyrinomonadaceae bacterium]